MAKVDSLSDRARRALSEYANLFGAFRLENWRYWRFSDFLKILDFCFLVGFLVPARAEII